jgi:hypothetical protein
MTIAAPVAGHHAAVVWLDGWHAFVARSDHGRCQISEVDRDADPESTYFDRVTYETQDCDRLMILGPGEAKLAFEREYVALYRRSDRLIDLETTVTVTSVELADRLRFLETI